MCLGGSIVEGSLTNLNEDTKFVPQIAAQSTSNVLRYSCIVSLNYVFLTKMVKSIHLAIITPGDI